MSGTDLSETKRLLLRRWSRDLVAGAQQVAPAVPPRPDPATAPLTAGQERLWFIEQLIPGTAAYHIAYALDVLGNLDVAVLHRAVAGVVRRHEPLRSRFEVDEDGTPRQRFGDADVRVVVHDLPEVDDHAATEVRDLVAERIAAPFDLVTGPPFRVEVLRLAAGRQVLLLVFHHLVFDGWSKGVFTQDLVELYSAELQDRPARLPALPVRYGDIAHHQRSRPAPEPGAYWQDRFDPPPPPLDLPTDRPRPAVQSLRGGREWFRLPAEEVEPVRALGKAADVTLFGTLLAGFAALLHRYSEQSTICLGSPVAGRDRPEWERLVGFFVNTVVVRLDLAPGMSFRDLLAASGTAAAEALDAQDVPFERVVDRFAGQRSLGRNPLFQVMFDLESTPPATLELPGARLRVRAEEHPAAQFDLMLFLYPEDGGLRGFLEYSRDLFAPASARRMVGHLRTLLAGAVARPDSALADLPLLPAAERREILVDWNRTEVDLGPDVSLPELVLAQVARTPDRPAVTFGGRTVDYAELARRARTVAAAVRSAGVAPGQVVAVALERGPHLVPALLGVLLSGAAYLPLDLDYPDERLDFTARDAGVPLVLTVREAAGRLAGIDAPLLYLDELPEAADPAPVPPVDPAGPAYVIYTSGSTGRPKGVVVSHRAIVNRLRWMQREYRLDGTDVVLQKTPYGFDVSVWELFWPLTAGAREVLAEPGRHGDPEHLAELVAAERVSTVHFVPSMLALLLAADLGRRCRSLRRVVCSGEALPAELAARFFALRDAAFPSAELVNLYGPTEAAVDVTAWRCDPADDGRVPIGRPIANTRAYVLDRRDRPVPVGMAGELHLAGVQLADGYLGRPELTAQRFVPDPYGPPGARMYRTGDLVRWRPGGHLEFLGRTDRQVKIRGQRVEPGEVEAVLVRHPAVSRAVVVARPGPQDGARLIGYVRPEPGAEPVPADLRAYLRERLPEAMVPALFAVVPEFPLSAHGKLDVAALPDPVPGSADPGPPGRADPAPAAGPTAAPAEPGAGAAGTPGPAGPASGAAPAGG
ncbi:amino acid adenylation domain-containing protein, partial [Micromonosporaceae bacterium B7E4]